VIAFINRASESNLIPQFREGRTSLPDACATVLEEYGFSWEDDWGYWCLLLGEGINIEINYLDMEVYALISKEVTKVD
jgi:hypothetical protein